MKTLLALLAVAVVAPCVSMAEARPVARPTGPTKESVRTRKPICGPCGYDCGCQQGHH